jgi:hypothetical protein
MKIFARGLALTAVLVLSIAAAAQGPALPAPVGPAQKDIVDLAKAIENGKDISKKVAAIQAKFGLDDIMELYKPRSKGGLGFGPEGMSIEAKLNAIGSKKGISKADLARFEKELTRAAQINRAIVELSRGFPPRAKAGKGPKEWNEYADTMQSSSLELIKAIKAGDTVKVKSIAANLTSACNGCHSDFR